MTSLDLIGGSIGCDKSKAIELRRNEPLKIEKNLKLQIKYLERELPDSLDVFKELAKIITICNTEERYGDENYLHLILLLQFIHILP